MPLWKSAGIALLGLIVTAAPTVGQSLADVARKEADRRKTVKEGGKVYTNKDLPNVPPPASSAPATPTVAAPDQDKPAQSEKAAQTAEHAGQEAGGKDTDKLGGTKSKDREYWGKRMKELRDHLDRDQTLADALQSRINALTTDFVNRDDPVQRAQIGTDRDKAHAELDRLKKRIVDDKRAIADSEEEARRSGVPPGWLR
jgi:hypothetical protein